MLFRNEGEARAERQKALQPDDEIKNGHPPADRKTAADVAAEDGIYCGRNLENVLRVKENFDELFCVPCVHKAQIISHHAAEESLVAREERRAFARVIENDIENVGALLA